jgi:MFS family permease
VNVGFAKLQMGSDLNFNDAIYGFGAGIFFIAYFIFEVPSNVILEKVGARVWIARIMITWGIISLSFMFTPHIHWGALATKLNWTDAEFTFYFLRFLLGAAEAGFFPGIILYLTYWFPGARRAKTVALFMTAIAIANVIGSPVSGAIMQYMGGVFGWRGWQWLFLLEGIPSVLMGLVTLAFLDDGPKKAGWLTDPEKAMVIRGIAQDNALKIEPGQQHRLLDTFRDIRVWALGMSYFCGYVSFFAVNFWMPTIVQELGLGKHDFLKIGLLSMVPWGVAAISMVVVGSHSDRTGERRWHYAGSMLVAMVGLIALALFGKEWIPAIIALTLITSGLLSSVVTFWSLPTAFLSSTASAVGIAWISSVGSLGGHVGPDLIGRIRTATNSTAAAFFALAAVVIVGAMIILLLPALKTRHEHDG